MMHDQAPFTEPIAIQEIFVTDLVDVDCIGGGTFRLTFISEQKSLYDGAMERVIVCRMVAGNGAIRRGIFLCAKAIGMRIIAELSDITKKH